MSRKTRGRLPPSAGFGSLTPAAGFGGFAQTQNKSGLGYLTDRLDLSAIADANAVVPFKNLLKKDGKTKARALEELVVYAQTHPSEVGGGVEDGILEVWVQLFPRLSVDSERRVRELAHSLQAALVQSAKKRMERHIPKVVGPWLAGVYDRDRAVARAASDGLAALLTTRDKARLLWQRCKQQILDYAAAALQETAMTLCDMRATSEEDAAMVWHRVLYSSLSLVLVLLQKLDAADRDALHDTFVAFFARKQLLACAVSTDSHVRRAAYDLWRAVLETQPALVEGHMAQLAHTLTVDAVKANQTGSAGAFLGLLTYLSTTHPAIWDGPTHPLTLLRPLLEKGSQGDLSHTFWQSLDGLLNAMHATCPANISYKEAANVLLSFRAGMTRREEPRSNAVSSWTAYLSMSKYLLGAVTPDTARTSLVETHVLPLFGHYLHPPDKSAWSTGAQLPIVTRAALLVCRPVYPAVVDAARAAWAALSAALVERMGSSLPQVSKDHARSQQDIAHEGDRWFALVHEVHWLVAAAASTSTGPVNLVEDVLLAPTLDLVRAAVDLLKRRDYKPFGAAHVVAAAFSQAPHLLRNEGRDVATSLFAVDADELSLLLASPSAPQLLACLRSMAAMPECADQYAAAFATVTVRLLASAETDTTATLLTILISDPSDYAATMSRSNEALQMGLRTFCLDTVRGTLASWDLFDAAFAANALAPATGKTLALDVIHGLGTDEVDVDRTLTALQSIARRNPEFLPQDEAQYLDLVMKLLAITERDDAALSAKVDAIRALIDTRSQGERPLIKIVQENLDSAGPDSLEIDTLVDQATELLKTATDAEKESLFPRTATWRQELDSFLQGGLHPGLALLNRLGGAYLLVDAPQEASTAPKRDQHGLSVPARMAAYALKVLQNGNGMASVPPVPGVELLYMLFLVAEIGSDQIAMADADSLWGDLSDVWAASVAEATVSAIRSLVDETVQAAGGAATCQALADTMLFQTRQTTPLGIYTARALSELLQAIADRQGALSAAEQERVDQAQVWNTRPETVLGAVAFLTGYGDLLVASQTAPAVSTLCNRLVSDVAGAQAAGASTLRTLVLLNACMAVYESGALPVATNRLVFTVRQITNWFLQPDADSDDDDDDDDDEDGDNEKERINTTLAADARRAAESCRALQQLLPCIADIYGPHWARSIRFCLAIWAQGAGNPQGAALVSVHAALKLLATLEALETPNDDLVDALATYRDAKWQGLLGLLAAPRTAGGDPAQELVDALLERQMRALPLDQVRDTDALYGLLGSESRAVQTAAFGVLHRALPAAQTQIAVDVLLENRTAVLPAPLEAWLATAPAAVPGFDPDEALATFPTALRGYLLAWHLVFDAFGAASAKVRGDYAVQLGASAVVGELLDVVCGILGHTTGQGLALERAGLDGAERIRTYDVAEAETEEAARSLSWLLVHLYYAALRWVPGMCRAWLATTRSKQTTVAVRAWTARYLSALLTDDVLADVAAWAATDEAAGGGDSADDRPLQVKINRVAREVVASYEVDDTAASMVVRLPATYPLDNVAVEGLHRVAASPRQWQSWMLIAQGVIAFSHGNLVEGLLAFRRNLVGALKGQSECAICYSIVSEDKRMPDKRCATCKNLFHRFCLYRWMETSHNNTCPLCRTRITLNSDRDRERRR